MKDGCILKKEEIMGGEEQAVGRLLAKLRI